MLQDPFSNAGQIAASSIAKWNGTTWSTLTGDIIRFNKSASLASITALAFVDTDLYIAGKFDSIGTKPMWHLAKWNGLQWENLGIQTNNFSQDVFFAEADTKGNIFVSGYFTTVDDFNSQYLAAWINGPGIIESVRRIDDAAAPRGFTFEQNYPNPFNKMILIK